MTACHSLSVLLPTDVAKACRQGLLEECAR